MSSGADQARGLVRERLQRFLASLEVDFGAEPDDDTPLVGSGLLDSLALVQLVLWVEEEIGHPLDPGEVDIPREWDTVGHFLDSVLRQRRA